MMNRVNNWLSQFLESLFAFPTAQKYRWVTWLWLAVLYLGGIYLWILFFNSGNFQMGFKDWYAITGPRLTFLQNAITRGLLPLHMSGTSALGGITNRYMAIPDAFLAPQAILLLFLSVQQFVVVDQVIMYSLGFLGLLWFKRKYSLSLIPFTVLFLLFNYNGHVLAHYAVGHDTWGGYFLFPWFVALVILLLEGKNSWVWVAEMSGLLFFMLLQGSFHQFVWSLLFLGMLGIFSWKRFWPAVNAGVFTILVSMVRILPPSLEIHRFADQFWGGYPTVADIWQAMVTIVTPGLSSYSQGIHSFLGWWEYDLYIGVIGAVFVLLFSVFMWLKHSNRPDHYRELIIPVIGLVVLSIGSVYRLVRLLPIALFAGERVSSRIISLAFVFLLIMAVIEFQHWLNSRRLSSLPLLGMVALLFVGALDLFQNFSVWNMSVAQASYPNFYFNPQAWFAVVHPDPAYTMMLEWGAAISILGFVLLGLLIWLEKRHILVEMPATIGQKGFFGEGTRVTPWLYQAQEKANRVWETVFQDSRDGNQHQNHGQTPTEKHDGIREPSRERDRPKK